MPMEGDEGRGQTQSSPSGMAAGKAAERGDTTKSTGGADRDRQDGSSKGQTTSGGNGGNKDSNAVKEAADQKAREEAARKSGEERRAKEAKEAKDAADRERAQQQSRAEAAAKETARIAKETADRTAKEAADRERAQQQARLDTATKETARIAKEAADREKAQQQARLDASKKVSTEIMVDKATGKIITVESGGDPKAKNPYSSAEGLGQFTDDTWKSMISKYRPDLLVGRTDAEILGLKTDPALSVEMTKNYTRENAEGLAKAGFPVNESTLYLSHFLGLGGAKKMLNAAADTPASDVAGGKAAEANPTILGEGKTAADVLRWAGLKMSGTEPFDTANVTSTSPTRGITIGTSDNEADLPAPGASTVGGDTGVDNYGRLPPKPEPTSWYDKLVSVFDSTPQIEALEDQGRLAGGLTKQEYADQFAGGDPTKVQSRIVDYGQGQQVDYFTKSLGDKVGEAVSDLGRSVSGAGRGITSLLGIPTGTGDASYFGDIPSAVPQVETGFGPGGDLTRDQYRDQYGGSDIALNLPPTGTPTTPKTPTAPTEPVVPTGPVMPTVPNFAAAQQYIGTPTVATPGFNFSMPFAPRPPIDFANLGQAYAPTALPSAPPLQPLPGIPGAMYVTPYQRLG